MSGLKAAGSSSATPRIPKLICGAEKEGLEQAIQQRIAERAYTLFEVSGRGDGSDLQHWLQAESEILQRGLEVRESGSWLAIIGSLEDGRAENVEIYLEPYRVLVRVTKSTDAANPEIQAQGLAEREVLLVEDLRTEVEPTTASASVRDQQLTLMVKKRYPASAARGVAAGS